MPVVLTRVAQTTQVTANPDGSHTTTKHSRIDELRTDIQQQIANVVDQRLLSAQQQIKELKDALHATQERVNETQMQHQLEIAKLREDQEQTQNKITHVEATVQGGTQTILEQMQNMMANMQRENAKQMDGLHNTIKNTSSDLKDELEGSITTIEREQNKRAKTNS